MMRKVCLLLVLMTVLVSLAACTLGDISDIFGYRFNDFTEEEKALFEEYIGYQPPFLPSNLYTVESYYDDGDYEYGIRFAFFGHEAEDYYAYTDKLVDFEYGKKNVDNDAEISFTYVKNQIVLEASFYGSTIDIRIYSTMSNDGAGLPIEEDGVFDVDFTLSEYAKDTNDLSNYPDKCPVTGSPAVLVIPVDFRDYPADYYELDIDLIRNAFLPDGESDYYTLHDYYYISSAGQLDLDITVLDTWFRPKYTSEYYRGVTNSWEEGKSVGEELILDEALAYLEKKMDLSKFDSDGNGTIDSVILVNTLPIDDREQIYWAYKKWNIIDNVYDGVRAYDYVWASYYFLYAELKGDRMEFNPEVVNAHTFIHEFGHILGLRDYYDYAYRSSPMEGFDIMDTQNGDHNPFSKFILGWVDTSRLVVTDDTVTLTLKDFSTTGDTIILANNWDPSLGAYQEYFILMYYKNEGLNGGEMGGYFKRDCVLVFHVNASLKKFQSDDGFYYDIYNSNSKASVEGRGSYYNLIEILNNGRVGYTFVEGYSNSKMIDDSGVEIGYSFVIDSITEEYATITFTAN